MLAVGRVEVGEEAVGVRAKLKGAALVLLPEEWLHLGLPLGDAPVEGRVLVVRRRRLEARLDVEAAHLLIAPRRRVRLAAQPPAVAAARERRHRRRPRVVERGAVLPLRPVAAAAKRLEAAAVVVVVVEP